MIFAPEGLIGIFHRVKAAVQHRSVERKHRTWLSDFFGITKPPLVEVPVTTDDGDAPLPRPTREARARAAATGRDRRRARHPQGGRHPGHASVASAPSTA